MSKKIVIVKKVEITLGDACDDLSDVQLVNDIQGLYDNCGEEAVLSMGINQETEYLYIDSINDEAVFNDGGMLDFASGSEVILDGSRLNS